MFTQEQQKGIVYYVVSPDGKTNAVMTMAEVAAFLRLHRSTVSRYAMSGELPSHKIGGRRLFLVSDVREFFDNRKVTREDGC